MAFIAKKTGKTSRCPITAVDQPVLRQPLGERLILVKCFFRIQTALANDFLNRK